uniref:hypothetical protein n=1 Tax=Candidatus Albibeggiatoa sp. nov. BB20 TaxID=3162723 RepID=UPI0033658B4A
MFSFIPFKNKIIVILLIIIILSTSTNIFAAPQFSTERRSLTNKAPSNSIKVKYGVSENQIVAPGNPIDVQRPAGTPVGAIDDIGTYQAGQSQVITYTITNPGYLGIAWRVVENFSISAENNVINTSVSPSSLTIPAGGSKDVQINFTPDENGNFSFTFGFEIFYFVDTRIGRIKIPNFIFPSYSFLVSGFSDGNSPTLTINQASGQSDPTNGSPIDFTVVFSEPVTDFTTGDIALSGTAGATTTTVTGSGTTYNVAVSGMTSDGTVIATINAGVAHDMNGNANEASTSTDNIVNYDYDDTGPSVTIEQASGQSDPTNGTPIDFTVVFSEPVTDFTTGDIALSGTAGATTTTVTGSGTTYNVAVSGMTSDGTVIATINAGVAHDSNNNGNDASTSIDNSVIFDSTPPKLISFLRHTPATSPTNADQLVFLATFNEDVQSVDSTDFEVDWSSPTAIAPNITTVSQQTNSTYTITVLGGDLADFNGNVGLNLVATPSITDSLGHSLIDIDPTTADEVYSVDNSPPTLTSFTRDNIPTDKKTNADILEFLVTFSEDVKNVDAADFEINSTPTTTAIIAAVTQAGTASTYTVTISGGDLDDFNGDVGLNLVTTHNITDLLDYVLPSVEPLIDEVYTVDNAGPILTSIMRDTPTSTPTNFDELIFSAIFDEDVTDVDIADFEVDSTSTATIESVTQVTPSTYAVKVSGGDLASFDGTVGIQLTTTLDIKDTLGHSMDYQTAATSEFYLVDNTNAEVSINQANTQVDPTNIEPILFDVLFNEDVIGFVENDVVITGLTGTPTVTVSDASDSDD